MPDEKNFMRWHFGSQASKDAIIVSLMNRVEELERKEAEREARKGVHPLLKELQDRTDRPKIIS